MDQYEREKLAYFRSTIEPHLPDLDGEYLNPKEVSQLAGLSVWHVAEMLVWARVNGFASWQGDSDYYVYGQSPSYE